MSNSIQTQNSKPFEESQEDDPNSVSFETDIVTVYLEMWEDHGATVMGDGIQLNGIGEEINCNFFSGDKVSSRPLTITWSWLRGDAGENTIDATLNIVRWGHNVAVVQIETLTAIDLTACDDSKHTYYTYEMSGSDVVANNNYVISLAYDDHAGGKTIIVRSVSVVYFVRRTLS